jgi:hypothetical protein
VQSSAASAADLAGMGRADEHVLRQPLHPIRTCASGTTIQPTRQPVMLKYLENELIT